MGTRGIRAALLAVALTVAVVLAGVAQSTASAAAPAGVSIQLFVSTFCCPEVGTWTATGAIADSGTYVRTGGRATGSIPDCFCNFEHPGAFQEEFVLTGAHGTLTVTAEQLATPNGEYYPSTSGVWQIESGTGAYGRVVGHGTDEFFPQTVSLLLTGVVSKAD